KQDVRSRQLEVAKEDLAHRGVRVLPCVDQADPELPLLERPPDRRYFHEIGSRARDEVDHASPTEQRLGGGSDGPGLGAVSIASQARSAGDPAETRHRADAER